MRQRVDARLQIRRQQPAQPQPHFEPNHPILNRERLDPRQERQHHQRRGDHDLEREMQRRVHATGGARR